MEHNLNNEEQVAVQNEQQVFGVGDVIIDTEGVVCCLHDEDFFKDIIGKPIHCPHYAWRLATEEEIDRWNESLKKCGLRYDKDERRFCCW